jgi:hypothetical protein
MADKKERPILFSGPMVRAILDGRKTQTRRAVKPQPDNGYHIGGCHYLKTGWALWRGDTPNNHDGCTCISVKNPYGWPGDLLWVRETFKYWEDPYNGQDYVVYKAGGDKQPFPNEPDIPYLNRNSFNGKWKPSIHMPKWAARIWLEVTGVKVERLQDITNKDARAEGSFLDRCGCSIMQLGSRDVFDVAFNQTWCHRHGERFDLLWDSINGKKEGRSWDDNPWVWVVEFKRVDRW